MRPIDADEVRKMAVPHTRGAHGYCADIRKWAVLVGDIDDAPTIDPESLRPTGRWEKHWCDNNLIGHMYEVCPNCRSCEILDTEKFWDCNCCPNCGADMRGEANGK